MKLKTTDSIAQPVRHFTQDPFCDKKLENHSNYKFADHLISGYEYFVGFQVSEFIYLVFIHFIKNKNEEVQRKITFY